MHVIILLLISITIPGLFCISMQVDKGMRDVLEIEELFDCKAAVNASFHFSKDKSQVCNWDKKVK